MFLVKVSSQFFEKSLATGADWNAEVKAGLPAGCRLEVVRYKHETQTVELFFTHPERKGGIEEVQIVMEKRNVPR